MRFLFICLVVVFGIRSYAQKENPMCSIGKENLFSNNLGADHILQVDSSVWGLEVSGINYYELKEIKEFELNTGFLKPLWGIKFSYKFLQENVFVAHSMGIGIQKHVGQKLITNAMLGVNYKTFNSWSSVGVVYSLACRYKVSSNVFIHQQVVNRIGENRQDLFYSKTSLQYKVSPLWSVQSQLDYLSGFDGQLVLIFHLSRFTAQLSHQFVRSSVEFGIGYSIKQLNVQLSYRFHELLGRTPFVKIQWML